MIIELIIMFIIFLGGYLMFFRYLFFSFIVVLSISCSSIPVKEYERVTALREKATKYDAIKTYSPEEFKLAEADYLKADAIVKAENEEEGKNAKVFLLTSETNYNLVIDKGYPDYANDLKTETDGEIQKNVEIKSEVLFALDIDAANILYQEALVSLESSNYDDTIDKLLLAKEKYTSVYTLVKEKYDKTDTALVDVKTKLSSLESMIKELETLKKKK